MKIPNGYMVAIEGIDAVGKKTHCQLLSRWLRARGLETTVQSFPDYATPIGKEIRLFLTGKRAYPVELQHMLFAANRWEKRDEIASDLRHGGLVVVNRYSESNLAYGMANGLDVDWLASLERGLPATDLVIVLEAPPPSLRSRRPKVSKDAYERSSGLQKRAQDAYRELAKDRGWTQVDANRPVPQVQIRVQAVVRESLGRDRGISI